MRVGGHSTPRSVTRWWHARKKKSQGHRHHHHYPSFHMLAKETNESNKVREEYIRLFCRLPSTCNTRNPASHWRKWTDLSFIQRFYALLSLVLRYFHRGKSAPRDARFLVTLIISHLVYLSLRSLLDKSWEKKKGRGRDFINLIHTLWLWQSQ